MGRKRVVSWTVVIIVMIFFWPVGLYLLYRKVTTDKEAAMKNSKALKVVGWIFLVIGILGAFGNLSDSKTEAADIAIGVTFFVGGGVLMLYAARKVSMSGEKFKKYIHTIINDQQILIPNIAAVMNLSPEQVMKDIQAMIDMGYFPNAYINYGAHELVLPDRYENLNKTSNTNMDRSQQKITVICKNCGGNNIVVAGQVCECEYCGSPIL